jgi:uncharacterized protein
MIKTQLKKQGRIIANEVKIAKTFTERFMGFMGRKTISQEDILVFPKCNSIHTFFMRVPIDVIFVTAEGTVVRIVSCLKPWNLLWPQKSSSHCIEMAANESRRLGIFVGDSLGCEG